MKIQFLGATRTVTGSRYLLTAEKKVLVDCGLFQGLKELRLRNRDPFPVNPATIDAVVLTHAHLDHTGYLPLLVKNGFRGKIYCTSITKEICKILLLDSAHLQEEEAFRANKLGYAKHKPALPLYVKADAEAVFPQLTAVAFHEEFTVGDMKFYFNRAGHIFGAGSLCVKHRDISLLFSGDLGRSHDPCVTPPEEVVSTNYLVIESTYGDRLHDPIDPKTQIGEIIRKTAERGGTIVIPAFAVGRTQAILYYIYQLQQENKIPNIPVFLDSPMAQDITDIALNAEKQSTDPVCTAAYHIAKYVNSVEDSKKIDTYAYPKIIISASGMATGGRVLHHIRAFGGDTRNTILFAGYQAIGTRGAALVQGKKEIKMFGEFVTVNAEVIALNNISAHVDYLEMLAWLKNVGNAPRKVFITHGDPEAADAMQNRVENTFGWTCVVPEYLQTAEL